MSWKLPPEFRDLAAASVDARFAPFRLPARLSAVAERVPAGARVVDVGTDHGLLPIALAGSGHVEFVVAVERSRLALERAKRNLRRVPVSLPIELRYSDGLVRVQPGECNVVTMCGVGGRTVREVLKAAGPALDSVERIVLQPDRGACDARRALLASDFAIIDEALTIENGRIFVVIAAQRSRTPIRALSEKELEFGPLLLRDQPIALEALVTSHAQRLRRALKASQQGGEYEDVKERLAFFEDALADLFAPSKDVRLSPDR